MSKRRRRGFTVPTVPVRLRESATTVADTPAALRETATFGEARRTVPDGSLIDVQIIRAGWGSSGYYPAKVLERDGPTVFPAGTHMFLDHPTETEEVERPERSVRDLAAVLAEDAYSPDGGKTLRAKARVFAPYRQLVAEAHADIGVSIRAMGTAQPGEMEGRTGPIIQSLTVGESVDFVTRAGAGGKVLALLESARAVKLAEKRSFGAWLESRLHLALTQYADDAYGDGRLTRDERIALSAALSDGLAAWTARVEADAPQLFQRDLYDDPEPDSVAAVESSITPPDGDPPLAPTPLEESMTQPNPAPAPGNGQSGSAGGQAPDATARPVALGEAERLSQLLAESRTNLAEANARADKADARAVTAERRATLVEAQRAAEKRTLAALAKSDLKEAAYSDVVAAVCDSLTLDEAGKVDETQLVTAIEAEIQTARTKVARLLEQYGVGSVTGLGANGGADQLTEARFEQDMAEVFQSIGLTEADAKLAAKGR